MKNKIFSLTISFLILFHLSTNAQTWGELGIPNSTVTQGISESICSDAAGNIYTSGGYSSLTTKKYVAKWDGTTWSELGGANSLAANNTIHSICKDGAGNIYAAGRFTNSSGNRYVAKWDGTTWSELGGLNGLAANYFIYSICSDTAGNIYAGGGFRNSSSNRYVAKWNGTTWSELGGLNGLQADADIASIYCDVLGNIYAGGGFGFVAKWNGTAWSALQGSNGLDVTGGIYTICGDELGNIYAAGGFQNSSLNKYVAKFDGTMWSELGGLNSLIQTNGNIGINSICSDAAGNIYAAGNFKNSAANYYVAKYDGTSWGELGGLNSFSTIAASGLFKSIYCDASSNIYAGGYFYSPTTAKYFVAKYGTTNTSINNVKSNNVIQIYPNPTSNELNIVIENVEEKISSIIIYNSLMQKCKEIKYRNEPIPVKDLSNGVYFIEIFTKDGSKGVTKFIKE